jgi:hypothetical protein
MAQACPLGVLGSLVAEAAQPGRDCRAELAVVSVEAELRDLALAYDVWEAARADCRIADERYISEQESLPAATGESAAALADVRMEIRAAREAVLGRLAAAEERLANAHLRICDAIALSMPDGCGAELRAAFLFAAYGPAIRDPWDLRPLIGKALAELALDPALAARLSASSVESSDEVARATRRAIDAYWLARLRTFSVNEEANAELRRSIEDTYRAAMARSVAGCESVRGAVAADRAALTESLIGSWREACERDQRERLERLRMWRAPRSPSG